MQIAVIGAGSIGATLSHKLVQAGEQVSVGVRSPDRPRDGLDPGARVATVEEALAGAEAVIVAIPGGQVPAFVSEHGSRLDGKVVLDASNDRGSADGSLHHLDAWRERSPGALVARAFCTVGWENFADPDFGGTTATLFWCGPDGAAGDTVEHVVAAVGLEPVRIGGTEAAGTLDGLTRLWFQLAFAQGLGRRLAFKLLRDAA